MKPHRVIKHRSTWSEPPRKVPCNTATDAPLLGNGDLGVCIGGPPEDQGYWIAKNDFWKMRSRHDSTGVRMFGTLRVSVPCLQGASYHVEHGQPCIVENPWPTRQVQVWRDGRLAEEVMGERFDLLTRPGEQLRLESCTGR